MFVILIPNLKYNLNVMISPLTSKLPYHRKKMSILLQQSFNDNLYPILLRNMLIYSKLN